MRLSPGGMAGWALTPGLVVGGLGAYPTWTWGGGEALGAELAAGLVASSVMMVSGLVTIRRAALDPAGAAAAFIMAGLVRAPACVALSGALYAWLRLPGEALLIWTAVFYLALLTGEGAWLARALRRGGGPRRPPPDRPGQAGGAEGP